MAWGLSQPLLSYSAVSAASGFWRARSHIPGSNEANRRSFFNGDVRYRSLILAGPHAPSDILWKKWTCRSSFAWYCASFSIVAIWPACSKIDSPLSPSVHQAGLAPLQVEGFQERTSSHTFYNPSYFLFVSSGAANSWQFLEAWLCNSKLW